jgi:hypothetical protein
MCRVISNSSKYLLVILPLLLVLPLQLRAQTDPAQEKARTSIMRDTLDGHFDFSRFLIDSKGFMPIPLIITEPALGDLGLAMALTFLTPKTPPPGKTYVAPDITAGFGMYTANKSWAAGGARIGSFPKAGIKYRVILGYASLNLSFYRDVGMTTDKEFKFNFATAPVLLSFSKNLWQSDIYLGGQYTFANVDVNPRFGGSLPEWLDEKDLGSRIGSLALFVDWDRRNNFFTPDAGSILHVAYGVDDDWTGSDYDYQKLTGFANWFIPINPRWISGLRLDAQHTFGNPPFYLLPMLLMRGLPAARYQGATTALVETEQRIDLNLRWSLVGFAGIGKAIMDDESFADAETAYAVGGGFRYLIARAFGIRAGIDIARGPEDWAWYITFGHNWAR